MSFHCPVFNVLLVSLRAKTEARDESTALTIVYNKEGKKSQRLLKERDCETWYFVCKDGGLILCDF